MQAPQLAQESAAKQLGLLGQEVNLQDRPRLAAGDHRGRYRNLRELGEGGTAVVNEAFDPEPIGKAAPKVLSTPNKPR